MSNESLPKLIDAALSPVNFFVGNGQLRVTYDPCEQCAWELFQGHLLSATQTRQIKPFQSWNVFLDRLEATTDTPLLSLKWDPSNARLYVVRNILSHAWETHESRPKVIEARPTQCWLPELVATIPTSPEIDDRCMIQMIHDACSQAVLGGSRLPITSLESPLPAYTFGNFSFFPVDHGPSPLKTLSHPTQVIDQWWAAEDLPSLNTHYRVLETVLRTADREDIPKLAARLFEQWTARHLTPVGLQQVVLSLFHHLSLSPYTDFVDHFTCLLRTWSADHLLGAPAVTDILSYVLRHLVRHLTAYDLTTFHHFGANYPDALLLDTMFREYIELVTKHRDLFLDTPNGIPLGAVGRIRRRALRQAWFCRQQYEGHLVPDRPTSPGENQRVLPDGLAPVPEQQLIDPHSRHTRLYADTSTDSLLPAEIKDVFDQSLCDLADVREQRELGMAIFLDRPLGVLKPPGEVDRTVLLSYPAFSQQIAQSRWDWLCQHSLATPPLETTDLQAGWNATADLGFSVSQLGATARHGVVALEDAYRVADDFIFLRTSQRSWDELTRQYDFSILQTINPALVSMRSDNTSPLLIRTSPTVQADCLHMTAFSARGEQQFSLVAERKPLHMPYVEIAGNEYITNLRIEQVWSAGQESTSANVDALAGMAIPPKLPGTYVNAS